MYPHRGRKKSLLDIFIETDSRQGAEAQHCRVSEQMKRELINSFKIGLFADQHYHPEVEAWPRGPYNEEEAEDVDNPIIWPGMENLYTALTSIKVLRSSVGQIFSSLANGIRADHGDEGRDAKFLSEIEELLNAVTHHLRDVETAVNNLAVPLGPFNLGNTSYLSQECTQERQALYSQLVLSYKWTDKIHEYSNQAAHLFAQNQLKRSYMNPGSAKRRRTPTSSHNVPPQNVDSLITQIGRTFTDMTVSISRPFAANVVLQISLGRVLQALVAFKGLLIEWVVVKGYGETLDLWTESRHKVFRKITENSHAAMLHFSSPALPELAVRSFMTWFHSYITLFRDPCKKCSNHLHCALPPTWRDLRTLEPYHEECRL